MFRPLALTFLALLTTVGSAMAADEQSLRISVRGNESKIVRLDHYTVAQPVAIRVDAPQGAQVTIAGAAPDGSRLRVPLQRGADGAYGGVLNVPTAGTWTLVEHTTIGGIQTSTGNIALVVTPPESHQETTLLLALAAVSIFGGLGLIAIGRVSAARSSSPAA